MKTSTYLFKQGYENLKKHGSKTFSTMLIISATMIVLGIFLILVQNVNENVRQAVEDALNGVRNCDYLSFRSNSSTSYSNNMIVSSGNRYA